MHKEVQLFLTALPLVFPLLLHSNHVSEVSEIFIFFFPSLREVTQKMKSIHLGI